MTTLRVTCLPINEDIYELDFVKLNLYYTYLHDN